MKPHWWTEVHMSKIQFRNSGFRKLSSQPSSVQRYIAKKEIHLHKKNYIKLSDITHREDPSESCINAATTAWISSRAVFGVHTGWTWCRKLISGKPFVLTTAIEPSQAKSKFFQSNKSFFNFEITGGKFILWNWQRWGEILTLESLICLDHTTANVFYSCLIMAFCISYFRFNIINFIKLYLAEFINFFQNINHRF